jgi:16S rRNA (uracil1498-N3)-methyltransferase
MSGLKRIYSHKPEKFGGNILLPADDLHYLTNVLRLEENGRFELMTSETIYSCKLVMVGRKKWAAEIESKRSATPPAYSLIACQCVLKREYMDSVIETYAELGVTKIIPVISERSLRTLPEKTLIRHRHIAVKAALISENEFIAEISEPKHIQDLEATAGDNILFYERGGKSALEINGGSVQFIIGPEGGFTDKEVSLLTGKGFSAVTPFSPILKAETAAVVFCGMIRAEM